MLIIHPKPLNIANPNSFKCSFCILFFIFRVYEVRTNSLFWRPVSVSDDVGGDLRKKPQIFSPSLSLPSFSYNIDIFIICQLKVIRGWILVKKHFTNSVCFLFVKLVLSYSHEIYNLATLDFLPFELEHHDEDCIK